VKTKTHEKIELKKKTEVFQFLILENILFSKFKPLFSQEIEKQFLRAHSLGHLQSSRKRL
jgi:hypothetical protein